MDQADRNPDALADGLEPLSRLLPVGGTTLYVEERGSGAAVLVIGAADEDAEIYRGIADRLAPECRVITYDRRGTRRSGRDGWPCDTARHADDAADLIRNLKMVDVTVLGASAGGLVALSLAMRHPDLVKTVLCFEPGLFQATDEGTELSSRVEAAIADHLDSNPGDWYGAVEVLGRAAATSVSDMSSLFTPPDGREWFARRTDSNAEALIRGDLPLTREPIDLDAVRDCPADLQFAYGTASLPVFNGITMRLAQSRGESPHALEGIGHSVFYHPDQTADYIRSRL